MTSGLVLAAVVLAVVVAVPVVRHVRADRDTRRSMLQAWLIRWRWHRLSRMLGPGRGRPRAGAPVGAPGRRAAGG